MSLVSILVPVYNAEPYLKKCLDSILNQTYSDIEIILINDGSTDHSLQIAKTYADNHENIHLFSYENAGISITRNRALQKAHGQYIMFVDSDDFIDAKTVETMMHQMKIEHCDMVTCGYVIDYPMGRLYRKGCKTGTMTTIEALDSLASCTGINNYPWAKLFKKSLFDGIQFPSSTHRFEDAYTIFKAMINAKRIGNVSKRYYHYVQHIGSLTNQMSLEMVYQMRDSVEYQDTYLKRIFPTHTFHFDQQYYNADMMILYTMIRHYRKKDHVKFVPSTIHWQQINPILHFGYYVWRRFVLWKLESSSIPQEDFGQ